MPAATAAPPETASEPPSQKSFCTSTTIRARVMCGSSSLVERLDGRLSGGELHRLRRQLRTRGATAFPTLGESGHIQCLAVANRRHLQRSLVVARIDM